MKKTICTITGIRPDFIRMSEIFKKLDKNFNHVLIHTGQHFDSLYSDIFFQDLKIRTPDFNIEIGKRSFDHIDQISNLFLGIKNIFKNKSIYPDLILFLGDSNSVLSSIILKKEKFKIAHIEAGMRSYDKLMFEEINRIICDQCSDYHFVYHENYKTNLIKENISPDTIFVVGNTIVEVLRNNIDGQLLNSPKKKNYVILDIHRRENIFSENRMKNIYNYVCFIKERLNLPIYMLKFHKTYQMFKKQYGINFGKIVYPIDPMSYKQYISFQYHSYCVISDSGTSQEECPLLDTRVIVPRDSTERPESVFANCSFMINVNNFNVSWENSLKWLQNTNIISNTEWLGDGKTSERVINIIKSL